MDNHAARAQQIAEYLTLATGEAWEQRTDQHGRDNIIFGPQMGEHLFISSVYAQRGRIEIHGSLNIGDASLYNYLRSIDYTPKHSITVREDRPPAEIAKEIARRLLPNYRRDLAKGLAAHKVAQDRQRQVEQIAAELAAALAGGIYQHTGERNAFYDGLAGCSVRGHVITGDSISFDITSVDLTTARAIVKAIRDNLSPR